MRKEFPISKWLRKHVTPGRFIIGILLYVVFLALAPRWIPLATLVNGATYMVCAWAAIAIPSMIWWLVWEIKHPHKLEFCKECGRALPEKFND